MVYVLHAVNDKMHLCMLLLGVDTSLPSKSSIDTMSVIKCDRPGPARSGVKKGFSTIMDSTEAASWSTKRQLRLFDTSNF